MEKVSDIRSSISICKRIKERLQNLEFVKKHTDEKIVEALMDFYEEHKPQFEKWNNQKKKT